VLYEKFGLIRVLLTTRSKLLRHHPGQTAFPGGRVDESDHDMFETAVGLTRTRLLPSPPL
jgi:peroxisomal coenzyme A diphosphatase NUDT7